MRAAIVGDMPMMFTRSARYRCTPEGEKRSADVETWQPLNLDVEMPPTLPRNPSGLGVWVLTLSMFGDWEWQALVAFNRPGDTLDSEE